jgi:hypothetical protein
MTQRSSRLRLPVIPTGDVRHSTKIREGSQSAEIWSRERRAELHETYDGPPARWGAIREVVNASQQVSKRGKKSVSPHAENIRRKKREASILRDGKQAREGKDAQRQDQKRIQKTKARKKVA